MSNVKKYARKVAKYTLTPTLSFGLLYGLADGIVWANNKRVRSESNTIVFSNTQILKAPDWTYPLTNGISNIVMYLPLTLRQNLDGNRVDWFNLLSREDVFDKLADDKYSNVIFIGHGSNNSFYANKGVVHAENIVKRDIPKKDGFLIQHTCGGGTGKSLREVLLQDPSRGYSQNGDGDIWDPFEGYFLAVKKLVSFE